MTSRILVAGIGNIFLCDDGFGVEVARRLAGTDLPDGVTVTARPQRGNPKPRMFRFPDERALVNRMGFNNAGAGVAAARLRRRPRPPRCPAGPPARPRPPRRGCRPPGRC